VDPNLFIVADRDLVITLDSKQVEVRRLSGQSLDLRTSRHLRDGHGVVVHEDLYEVVLLGIDKSHSSSLRFHCFIETVPLLKLICQETGFGLETDHPEEVDKYSRSGTFIPVESSLMTLQQVAGHLGVSRRRVQALVQSRQLPADRIGNQWVVERSVVDAAENVRHHRRGRPLGEVSCWSSILYVADGNHRMAAIGELDAFRRRVRNRAVHERCYVHPSEIGSVLSYPGVVSGGADAAIAANAPLDDPDVHDVYVRSSAFEAVLQRSAAVSDERGNVIFHVVADDAWPFGPGESHAGLWVAWLDLADRQQRDAQLVQDRLIGGRVRA
jgi:excisionase family DNA binding protein